MLWASSRCFFIRVVDPSTRGTHVISPAFWHTIYAYTPCICRHNQNGARACIVLPQPGVGKFGTAGMNCTLGRNVLRLAYFAALTFLRCRWFFDVCAIDSKFFCFRIMNRSIRLFCGRTHAKPSRHTIKFSRKSELGY